MRLYSHNSSEICRVIRYDSVLTVDQNENSNQFNFDGSMSRISANHVTNVSSDGVIQNGEENETKKILSYDGTDPTNGEKMTVRADGFTKVQRLKETIFQFPDGTRVTKSDNDVQIEKPGLPCVLFEENAKKCLVVLGNGTLIQVENTGNHHLSHQSGASFAVGEDGTVLFTPQQEATSTHIIRQMDQNALEIIGRDKKFLIFRFSPS